jgi:hypothetical protein
MTHKKTLPDLFKEVALNKFFKQGPFYYQIEDLTMNQTGRVEIDAKRYSQDGEYKGLIALIVLPDNCKLIEGACLPFKINN